MSDPLTEKSLQYALPDAAAQRPSQGRLYDDFKVGDVYKHWPGRTINETDNTWFTLLTMNTHPLHFDAVYATQGEFGRIVVNSCLTLSMVVGMSVSDVSQNAIGNLGWKDVRLIKPVFIGDTIYAESTVASKRESVSRPGQGIVTVHTRGLKADQTTFLAFERTFLIPKQSIAAQPSWSVPASPQPASPQPASPQKESP